MKSHTKSKTIDQSNSNRQSLRVSVLAQLIALAGLCAAVTACGSSDDGGNGNGGNGNGGNGADSGPIPNDGEFEAVFTWAPIDLDTATDLGEEVAEVPQSERTAPSEVDLSEVAASSGLGGSVAGGNPHGVGVGFVDIDGDTFHDIVLITGEGTDSQVYRNNGDGTFSDFTDDSNIGTILENVDGYSVASADYDRDGDLDLYVGAMPRDFLLRNNGSGVFTDVTTAAGAGGPNSTQPNSSSKIVAWGDYDNDGLMDIAVSSSTFDSGRASTANAYLLRNLGNGQFSDVSAASGIAAAPDGNPCAMMWSDFDSDGDQDLWIWNDRNPPDNRALLRNDGSQFTDITESSRIDEVDSGNPMGIDGADVDHDGHLDYYISDIAGSPFLYNDGNGTFRDIRSVAGAGGEASNSQNYAWGLGFEDLNADTFSDLFVAQETTRPYLTFTNLGQANPRFSRAEWDHGSVNGGHNVAVAFADYDHNGTVDMVTAGTGNTRVNLYRNDTDLGSHRFLEVRVSDTPDTGENGGISGRVMVKTGDLVQFRDITAGSSRASQNAMSVRFGLGNWTGAEWVAVLWPDGRQIVVKNVAGNRVLDLSAP